MKDTVGAAPRWRLLAPHRWLIVPGLVFPPLQQAGPPWLHHWGLSGLLFQPSVKAAAGALITGGSGWLLPLPAGPPQQLQSHFFFSGCESERKSMQRRSLRAARRPRARLRLGPAQMSRADGQGQRAHEGRAVLDGSVLMRRRGV